MVREFGDGVLARGAAAVHRVLVIELGLLVAAAPGLVLLVLLVPDVSNAPLAALALVPVAPAVSAAVFAWRACLPEPGLEPMRHFVRGYRANALDVLRWWVPTLVLLTVLVTNLAHLEAAVPAQAARAAVRGVLLVLLGAVVLWSAHMLVLTSLAVLACGVVVLTSDWVLALLGSLFALLLLHGARPMVADVEENHTA